MAARQPARAPALAAAPAATITISGSIRRIRIAWPSRTIPVSAFRLRAVAPGKESNCQTDRCITSRPTISFPITFMATDKMAHRIEARVAPEPAALVAAEVSEVEQFRAAPGLE